MARNSLCGRCVQINGPNGTIRANVRDRCEWCEPGDFDATLAVFDSVSDVDLVWM